MPNCTASFDYYTCRHKWAARLQRVFGCRNCDPHSYLCIPPTIRVERAMVCPECALRRSQQNYERNNYGGHGKGQRSAGPR